MSKTVPTTYTTPSLLDFGAGEPVYDDATLELVHGIHHVWSRAGARAELLRRGTLWDTTSASYVAVASGRKDATLQLRRPSLVAGVLSYQIRLRVYGRDFDVRLSVTSPDGATVLGTVSLTRASGLGWGWSQTALTLTLAQIGEGGAALATPRALGLALEARRSTTKAELWQAEAFAPVGVAAGLPSGA